MTGTIGGMICAVTATAIIASIASSLARTKAMKEITRIAGSLVLILAILTPLAGKGDGIGVSLPGSALKREIGEITQTGVKKQQTLIKSAVAAQMSEYIEEKAQSLYQIKCSVTFKAVIDENDVFQIESATILYPEKPTEDQARKIGALIAQECGVPVSSQEHKGR